MTLVISVFEQGMIYAIMALGMYITYKILDFPDMTVDGSFPLGASLSAVLISQGMNPYLTLLLSFAAGLMAGTITGLIHVKLKVRDILASIIMMTALYSVNLRIAGKANLPIYNYDNIYNNSLTNHLLGGALSPYKNLIIIAIIVVIVKCVLDWYLKTKSGYLLKAVGDNETLVTSMGIDKGKIKILGLAIANGLVSLSGSMFAQQQRFFDASMGVGTAVIGLASVIIGEVIVGKRGLEIGFFSSIFGSIIYRYIIAAATKSQIFPAYALKLVSACIVAAALALPAIRYQMGLSKMKRTRERDMCEQ